MFDSYEGLPELPSKIRTAKFRGLDRSAISEPNYARILTIPLMIRKNPGSAGVPPAMSATARTITSIALQLVIQAQRNTGSAGVPPAMSAAGANDYFNCPSVGYPSATQYWERGRPARNERRRREQSGSVALRTVVRLDANTGSAGVPPAMSAAGANNPGPLPFGRLSDSTLILGARASRPQ